jgi:exosortase/archaeosortase
METEWLTDVGKFYIALKNADPLVYENNVIKFLRNELDFKENVIWFVFLPFCLYMAMCIFYFCHFITDETQFNCGFFHGKTFSVVLRVGITVLTSYFLFVELKQLMYTGAKYLLRL